MKIFKKGIEIIFSIPFLKILKIIVKINHQQKKKNSCFKWRNSYMTQPVLLNPLKLQSTSFSASHPELIKDCGVLPVPNKVTTTFFMVYIVGKNPKWKGCLINFRCFKRYRPMMLLKKISLMHHGNMS